MTTPERESILNAHNLLFTVLSLSLLVPKAVLSYKGESAAPNALDWAYGILLAVAFYWLGQYNKSAPSRHRWFFKTHFPSLLARWLRIRHVDGEGEDLLRRDANALNLARNFNVDSSIVLNLLSDELRRRVPRPLESSSGRIAMALSTFRDNLDLGIISATEMPFLGAVVESIIFITDTLPNFGRRNILSFSYTGSRWNGVVLPVNLALDGRDDHLQLTRGMREPIESVIRDLLLRYGWRGWRGLLAQIAGTNIPRHLQLDTSGEVQIA